MSGARIVYYDHGERAEAQPRFPHGEAGPVVVASNGEWTADTEVWISPNSHCALLNHGVARELGAIESVEGSVGNGLDALVAPAAAERVARIFYEADRQTYGARYDFLACLDEAPVRVEYRIQIDNREYQQTLSRLQFLATTAARHGHGIRLRL